MTIPDNLPPCGGSHKFPSPGIHILEDTMGWQVDIAWKGFILEDFTVEVSEDSIGLRGRICVARKPESNPRDPDWKGSFYRKLGLNGRPDKATVRIEAQENSYRIFIARA